MANKDNYILAYYQQIKDGRVIVGKWVRMLYERIISDLEEGRYFYDGKKAASAIEFIENRVHHSEGKLAPGLLKLELWQKAEIACIFGLVDADGNRHYREILDIEGRKNGKTIKAAGITEHMIYNDGEYGARGFMVAPKLDQADLCYQTFWNSVQLDPELAGKTKSRKSDLYVKESNSSIKKIAFNAKKSDGFNPTIVVCDEIAAWPAEQGLKQYEVMASAFGAREQGILLAISTAGYIDEGIYDELLKRATRFLNGESGEKRFLPFLYMVDDVTKWNDINELRKSMPNLGVSVSVDFILEEIAKAEGSLSKKAEFIAKYCNIKQNASTAWLSSQAVGKCCGDPLHLEDFAHSYCVAGIDLSQTRDLTAACVVIERGGELYVFAHFWLPAEKIDEAIARDGVPYRAYIQRGLLSPSGENFVDYHDCYNWLVGMVEHFEILPLKIGYDRYSADYLTQDLKAYGFQCDDVFQGSNLYGVMQETAGLIEDGKLHIGDNDLLKIHFLDSAIKMDNERGRGRLVKVNNSRHIDGMAALLDAMTVRQKWAPEIGEQLKNKRG